MRKSVLAGIVVLLLMPLGSLGFLIALGAFGSDPASACAPSLSVSPSDSDAKVTGTPGVLLINGREITDEQIENASVIVGVARTRKLSSRDALIGLMVAIQESHLINVHYGHLDSLGLFQQRSSWGTAEQRTNPVYASNAFFDALVAIKDRKKMSLLDVALAVQRPSRAAYLSPINYFPGWEPLAKSLLGKLGISANSIGGVCAADTGVPGEIIIAPGANFPNQPITSETLKWLAKMAGIYGKPMTVTTGTNHSYFTVDGNVSDHASGHAADFGMVANGGTDDGPVGDAMMTACLRAAGDSYAQAAALAKVRNGPVQNRVHNGYRIQCIWGTDAGGNHHNHLHAGAQPLK